MNIEQLLDLANKAIELAKFDRERFRVKAAQHPDGSSVGIHADTRFHFPEPGRFLTNYQPISLEDADGIDPRQLVDIVEGAVKMLEWKVEEAGKQ